jgi:pimeloyl-ACP methyl ester carboxylesterase
MLELLNPSLPGAARAVAGMARFRLQVAATPSSRKSAVIAQRFMAPTRRDGDVTVDMLLADLQRFAPDWQQRLGTQDKLRPRMARLLDTVQRTELPMGADRVVLYQWQGLQAPARRNAKPRHALLSHGWESYALSYALVIERLLARGYTVHAVDHVAHGASSGQYSGLPRFAEVLAGAAAHLRDEGIAIDLGIGHSLGAGAWLMAATRLGVEPRQLLLLAPFIDTPELLGKWLKLHGLSQSLRPAMQQAMMSLHGPSPMVFEDMETTNLAERLRTPCHVVQDPRDFVAPMRHVRALAERNPRVTVSKAEGAGHVGVLFAQETLEVLDTLGLPS